MVESFTTTDIRSDNKTLGQNVRYQIQSESPKVFEYYGPMRKF